VLFLLFQLGDDRYALDARQIVEVLPLLGIKRIPRAPAGVAGVCNYRGIPVPVIDLSELALGRPASQRLSTRIVLVSYRDAGDAPRLLGLIAEQATETLRREASDFRDAGVTAEDARYLGPVLPDARGMIQWIDAAKLLPEPVHAALFKTVTEDSQLSR
jgi:chemotaxis-related protein WspB